MGKINNKIVPVFRICKRCKKSYNEEDFRHHKYCDKCWEEVRNEKLELIRPKKTEVQEKSKYANEKISNPNKMIEQEKTEVRGKGKC